MLESLQRSQKHHGSTTVSESQHAISRQNSVRGQHSLSRTSTAIDMSALLKYHHVKEQRRLSKGIDQPETHSRADSRKSSGLLFAVNRNVSVLKEGKIKIFDA